VRDALSRRDSDNQLTKSLPSALRSVGACRWRACSPELLMRLKGFGSTTAGVRGAAA
jgi:hypothetical protein